MEVMAPRPDASGGTRSSSSPSSSSSSSSSSSPEFEFWMVRNPPSSLHPNLLSADELFLDGVILPLHLLHLPTFPQPPSPLPHHHHHHHQDEDQPPPPQPAPPPAAPSTSKRWRDIFRGEKRAAEEKERRRDRKTSAGGAAELNINLWPFSRSRSAGTGGGGAPRPKGGAAGRRTSSAPCSRSNSRGESTKPVSPLPPSTSASSSAAKKRATSPSRPGLAAGGGVHVGRLSPVWRIRRGGGKKSPPDQNSDAGAGDDGTNAGGDRKGGGGVSVLNTCIGYGQQQPSCGGEDRDGSDRAPAANNGTGSHFNLKTFFSKKVS